jgi:hypothetical protein
VTAPQPKLGQLRATRPGSTAPSRAKIANHVCG